MLLDLSFLTEKASWIEFLKFDVTIKKINEFKFVKNLKAPNDSHQISYETLLSIGGFAHNV